MALKVLLLNPPYRGGRGFNREGRCTQEADYWSTEHRLRGDLAFVE